MEMRDRLTGRRFVRKLRRPLGLTSKCAFELTFTCYRRLPFLSRDRTREWFIEALQQARVELGFQLWGYVIMPEHTHLLVCPRGGEAEVGKIRSKIKEPVARRAISYLRLHAPDWLPRIAVREGKRLRHRFWQPGGGYDRAVIEFDVLSSMIDYIHANPVRRGLVQRPTDYVWSSARWYAELEMSMIEMDRTLPRG